MFNIKMFTVLVSCIIATSLLGSYSLDTIEAELSDTEASTTIETIKNVSDTQHNTETKIISDSYLKSYTEESEESNTSAIPEEITTVSSEYDTYAEKNTYTTRQSTETTFDIVEKNDIEENIFSDSTKTVTATSVAMENKTDTYSINKTLCNSNFQVNSSKKQVNSSKKKKQLEDLSSIKSERTINTKFDLCKAVLFSDDIYYIGYNHNAATSYIFTLNSKDKITNSAKLANNVGSTNVKQIDDKIYVVYRTYSEGVATGSYCKIFSKELNLLGEYNLSKFPMEWIGQISVNENNIFYTKGMKIYSINYNGKNKKAIFDLSNEKCDANYINTIAANNKYVAFVLQDPNNEYYYGVVDLKTGKSQIIKNNDIDDPKVYGESIMWTGRAGFDEKGVFSSSKKIIIFNNGQFRTINTKTDYEASNGSCSLTSEGEVVTMEYSKSKYGLGVFCIRIYDINGKCVKEFFANNSAASGILANNRIIAYNFDCDSKTSNKKIGGTTKLIEY